MRRLALALSLAVAALAPANASAQLTKEAQALRSFAADLDNASTAPDFVGLAVAVVRQGKVVLMRTYGVREAGRNEKVTPDTVFRIASLSKGFASTLAVLEQSEGKLNLQTRVTTLVPEFKLKRPADAARVTFEDVLSHRTGLPPYAYDNLLESGTPPTQILSAYGSVKQTCSPGECFTYQNVAFNMITALIEKATGKSYPTELRERILGPLDMRTASVGQNDLLASSNWARPHKRVGEGWVPVPDQDAGIVVLSNTRGSRASKIVPDWLDYQLGLPKTDWFRLNEITEAANTPANPSGD